MRNPIDKIVESAITDLAGQFPGLVGAIVKEGLFVTRVQDGTQMMTIVDFESSMTYDPQEFYAYSRMLYQQFAGIERWYE